MADKQDFHSRSLVMSLPSVRSNNYTCAGLGNGIRGNATSGSQFFAEAASIFKITVFLTG